MFFEMWVNFFCSLEWERVIVLVIGEIILLIRYGWIDVEFFRRRKKTLLDWKKGSAD